MTESNENEKLAREKILAKTLSAINGDRDLQYGTPEQSFNVIAGLWSVFLDMNITPEQTATMMALFKIARIKTGANKEDNFVDGCGYIAIAGELAEKAKLKNCEVSLNLAKEIFKQAMEEEVVAKQKEYEIWTDEGLAEGKEEVDDDFYTIKIKRKVENKTGFDVWNYFRTYKRHKDVTDAAFNLPTNLSYNQFKERLTPEIINFLKARREV